LGGVGGNDELEWGDEMANKKGELLTNCWRENDEAEKHGLI
jgi:hypothetical protein